MPLEFKPFYRLLCLLTLFVFSVHVAAAQFSIGLRSGVLYSKERTNTKSSETEIVSESGVYGYTVGIPVEFTLSKAFSIQPEFNIQRRGSYRIYERVAVDRSVVGISSQRIQHIEIPILFKYRVRTERFYVGLNAGPSISYASTGKEYREVITTGGFTGQSEIFIQNSAGSIPEGTRRADIGGHFGVQLGLHVGIGDIILDTRYQVGFLNLNMESEDRFDTLEDYESKAQGYSVTLGYMIPFGRK